MAEPERPLDRLERPEDEFAPERAFDLERELDPERALELARLDPLDRARDPRERAEEVWRLPERREAAREEPLLRRFARRSLLPRLDFSLSAYSRFSS